MKDISLKKQVSLIIISVIESGNSSFKQAKVDKKIEPCHSFHGGDDVSKPVWMLLFANKVATC